MVTCLSPLPHTTCVLNTTLKSSHWGLPLILLQYYIIVCLSWRGVCTKFKMKNSQIIIQKSALDTVLLYLNATGKTNALLFQTIPNTIKKNHNKWNKNTTHRKKYKPASSILLCSFRGCIIFTSPPPPKKKKKPTPWYCTASPAVLSPLHFSNPPPPPPKKAQINNMLLIYTRRWRYKIEIITVHVQHAGLIFNADFFVLFSIYIRI